MHLHNVKYNNVLAHWSCSLRSQWESGRAHLLCVNYVGAWCDTAMFPAVQFRNVKILYYSFAIHKGTFCFDHLSLLFCTWCFQEDAETTSTQYVKPQWSDRPHAGVLVMDCSLVSLFSLFSVSLAHFSEHLNSTKLTRKWNGHESKKLFLCLIYPLHLKNLILASNETMYFIYSIKWGGIYYFLYTFDSKMLSVVQILC